jgi:hypothetical protein
MYRKSLPEDFLVIMEDLLYEYYYYEHYKLDTKKTLI